MKIANIRDFRSKALTYLRESESVLITRHGKITGILYPIKDTDTLPQDMQKEFARLLATTPEQQEEQKRLLLDGLRKALKIKRTSTMTIEEIRNAWTFKGKLSDEIIAEREKR